MVYLAFAMMFSIIIPTYNSEKTIASCLKSIVSQTWRKFEILVIDGLSFDKTLEICKSFDDERIKIISEKDEGIYDAMNKGINLARGDWLYFLGSDDCLFTNEVLGNVIVRIIEQTKIIYGNVLISNYAGWAKDGTIYDGKFNLNKILTKNICHQSIFYHKDVFKKLKEYNIQYKICADYDFNLKAYSLYKFEYIDLIIAKFSGGGLSYVSIDENFNLQERILKHFQKKLFLKEFTYLRNEIKNNALASKSFFLKIFLLLIYLKHRIYSYY